LKTDNDDDDGEEEEDQERGEGGREVDDEKGRAFLAHRLGGDRKTFRGLLDRHDPTHGGDDDGVMPEVSGWSWALYFDRSVVQSTIGNLVVSAHLSVAHRGNSSTYCTVRHPPLHDDLLIYPSIY